MTFGSLFAGIGGFDLGLERCGMSCQFQVEIDDGARSILEKHWPNVRRFKDVRDFPGQDVSSVSVDMVCGGFPCQDISSASATRSGLDGERSGLWFEFARIIRVLRPSFVLIENSPMLLVRGLDRILCDLAELRFNAEWRVYSAEEFGAPHTRKRLYVLAYTNEVDGGSRVGIESHWSGKVLEGYSGPCLDVWLQTPDRFDRVDDGVSAGVYKRRVGALGNAVVPQIVEFIGRLIMAKAAVVPGATDTTA